MDRIDRIDGMGGIGGMGGIDCMDGIGGIDRIVSIVHRVFAKDQIGEAQSRPSRRPTCQRPIPFHLL